MRLDLMTWQEVENYLKQSKVAIVPIGSTEQHGPMGLVGTDALTAETIGRELGEQENYIVTPTISVGMAQHHLAFPGSISLRPTTLIAVIQDYITSLARHGFEYFFFVNGHGGNVATTTAAFNEIYANASFSYHPQLANIRCKLCSWFILPEVTELAQRLFGDQEGYHATPSEVAVTQYAFPEAQKKANLEKLEPKLKPFTHADDFRRLYPDGRMVSDSSLATPELGKQFVDTAVKAAQKELHAFLNE